MKMKTIDECNKKDISCITQNKKHTAKKRGTEKEMKFSRK